MALTKKQVVDSAKDLGFDLVGFSSIQYLHSEIENLKKWLGKNYNAGMKYMEENLDKRFDPTIILPTAKSVISLGLNYHIEEDFENLPNHGKVSRYAWGKDYHIIIWEKLDQLISTLHEIDNKFEAKSYVDTGPVMDKAWAVKSGLGWMGKHSNIINRNIGSWFFIANIFNNFDFEPDKQIEDFCGTCTACIDACPTNAIVEDYVIDSNKCISYLTIENKNEIPDEFNGKFENFIFGCDICQDVCPWNNKFSIQSLEKEFTPIFKEIDLNEFEEMTNSQFRKKFSMSPINRARVKGMKRNAQFLKDFNDHS